MAHSLGRLDDLVDGEMRRVAGVGPHGLLICNVQGEIFAIDDNCSHADTPLTSGRLRGWQVTCPLHGARFDVRDGSRHGLPICAPVNTYDTTSINGEVIVSLS